MIFLILSYLGGMMTLVSPCILPVLPFVFVRAGQPFYRGSLPLLVGMAVTFAGVASLTTVGGGWVVHANQYGRAAALVVLGLLGLTLLWDGLADRMMRPFVRVGGRLSAVTERNVGVVPSFLLGIATGLLWAPCAGPILGLILTGAALQGVNIQTLLLLLFYAAGAATSLGLVLLSGPRLFARLKRVLGAETWLRRGLGVAVLTGVAAIALGADRGILTDLSWVRTSGLEQKLLDHFSFRGPSRATASVATAAPVRAAPGPPPASAQAAEAGPGPGKNRLDFTGATLWLNSLPLNAASLRGRVVLVDFWTYSCINCLRSLPYVRAWAREYGDQGLVVIGVHTPEFAFEKDVPNIKTALRDLKITYPVVVDNDYAIWRAFDNEYWPAHYLFDTTGRLRGQYFGEGDYGSLEKTLRGLLAERNGQVARGMVRIDATGREAAADDRDQDSPETYLGYQFARSAPFVSLGGVARDTAKRYTLPVRLRRNAWGLAGEWIVGPEHAVLVASTGRIVYRFHARDLHLVLGPRADGRPVRFRISLDGLVPGADHGVDTDAQGRGTVAGHRLYQLVRQRHRIRDRTFDIEFLDSGAQVFSFTFG